MKHLPLSQNKSICKKDKLQVLHSKQSKDKKIDHFVFHLLAVLRKIEWARV